MNVRAATLSAIYKLPTGASRRALFASTHRRMPHFRKPLTFSDKVNWRILNDRRPLLEWTCDKLAMKEHARHVPGLHIPDTLWAGTDLRELTSARLPEHWILKPDHRTGLVYFGHGQARIWVRFHPCRSVQHPRRSLLRGVHALPRQRSLPIHPCIVRHRARCQMDTSESTTPEK